MRYSDLKSLKNLWLSSQDDRHPKAAAYSVIILTFLEIPEDSLNEEISNNHLESISIALKIDNTRINSLDPASVKLLKELNSLLNKDNMIYITGLTDAIQLLEGTSIQLEENQRRHVARVFRAIEQIRNNPNEITNACIPIEVKESNETFIFYFHGENYPNNIARRTTINRLHDSLITIWNDAVENKQLSYFLSNIQGGPCIEGATREALAKLVTSLQQKTLPTDFDTAMALYYSQATHFLRNLHLPETFINVREVILTAYNGTRCSPKDGRPNTINETTVSDYISTLGFYDTRYRTENFDSTAFKAEIKTLLQPLDVDSRLCILKSLLNYAPPETIGELNRLIQAYEALCTFDEKELSAAKINHILSSLIETDTLTTPLFGSWDVIYLAASFNQLNLIEALLEYPPLTINYVNKKNLSFFYHLANCKHATLESLFIRNKKFIMQLDGTTILSKHPTSGYSPLAFLTCQESGIKILTMLLTKNPALLRYISGVEMCQVVADDGRSIFYNLCKLKGGKEIIEMAFKSNLEFASQITKEALFWTPSEGTEHSGKSAFYWLSVTGINILFTLFQQNPNLKSYVTGSMLCKIYDNGFTLLSILSSEIHASIGRKILYNLLEANPALAHQISGDALCHQVSSTKGKCPVLRMLSFRNPDQKIMEFLLNNNPDLPKQITSESLYQNYMGFSAFGSFSCSEKSLKILKILFQNNANLKRDMTGEALCQENQLRETPLFRLASFNAGQDFLSSMLEYNPKLSHQITTKALCLIPMGFENSPVQLLMNTTVGRNILQILYDNNPGMRDNVNKFLNTHKRDRVEVPPVSSVVPQVDIPQTTVVTTAGMYPRNPNPNERPEDVEGKELDAVRAGKKVKK